MRDVAAQLHGIARRVRVLDIAEHWRACPDKGDISDWFADGGGTAEALWILVDATPDWRPRSERETPGETMPTLADDAYHGLAGDIVRTIEPTTESHPAAILLQFLAAFGNAVGNKPHYLVEETKHGANLFVLLAGPTGKGRKGTSEKRIRALMAPADSQWSIACNKGGLSSGEGLIDNVRDETKKWNDKEKRFEITDPGVADKRLMITQAEFSSVLAVMARAGNTLSQVIRLAYDGDILRTLTRNSPLIATGAHISIIGHITDDDLRYHLTQVDTANGYANRFLYVRVKRVRDLAHGGQLSPEQTEELGRSISAALLCARDVGRVEMSEPAKRLWEGVYPELAEGQPGLLGAVIGRAEAQVVRLALIYALLDAGLISPNSLNSQPPDLKIEPGHLRAALAVWDYCEVSARQIFGDKLGSPIADTLRTELDKVAPRGLSRTDISNLFGRHAAAHHIAFAIDLLKERGLIRIGTIPTGGRPTEMFYAVR